MGNEGVVKSEQHEQGHARPQRSPELGLRASEVAWMVVVWAIVLACLQPLNDLREESLKVENLPKMPGDPIPDFTLTELYDKYGPDKIPPPSTIIENNNHQSQHHAPPAQNTDEHSIYARKRPPVSDTRGFGCFEPILFEKQIFAVVRSGADLPKPPADSRILSLGVGALFVPESTAGTWWFGRELRCNPSLDKENFHIVDGYEGVVHRSNLVQITSGDQGLAPIPKIVHLVWTGNTPLPTASRTWSRDMIAKHPDWQIVTWTESDIAKLRHGPVNRVAIDTATNNQIKSDVIKYEILYWFGGVVLSADHVWIGGDIDKVIASVRNGLLVVRGNRAPLLSNSLIAAAPRHPVILNLNKLVRVSSLLFWGQAPWFATGGMALTQAVMGMAQPGNTAPYQLASLVVASVADFDFSKVCTVVEEENLICRRWDKQWHQAVKSDKVHRDLIRECSKTEAIAYDMGYHVNRLGAGKLNITHIHK